MDELRYRDFWKFIKLLSDNGLLGHVIVIGSWAEYVYAQGGVLKDFEANLRTLDIDFLVRNMKRPTSPVSLTTLARQAGCTVDADALCGTTKIYTPDLMEIEFLILQQGSGEQSTLKTNRGVSAQALRHLAIVRDNTLTVSIFDMDIIVPEPEAYVLHKIIINDQRGRKAEKDRDAIFNLLPHLDKERIEALYNTLTAKEKRLVAKFFEETGAKGQS